jgi:hypothetical protein
MRQSPSEVGVLTEHACLAPLKPNRFMRVAHNFDGEVLP